MLINDKEALSRLSSPLNLMNKLKAANGKKNGMSIFGLGTKSSDDNLSQANGSITPSAVAPPENPFSRLTRTEPESKSLVPSVTAERIQSNEEPKTESLIDNADAQIKLATAHNNALEVLDMALRKAKDNIDNIDVDKLPSMINSASKVVESIRKERNEVNKAKDNRQVHLHFYTPAQKSIQDYEVITVG